MIVARTGDRPTGALPLAGSLAVWFEPEAGTAPEVIARRSALRAPLCGLTLDRPRIMGILNVTPDSFSDGGTLAGVADAVARARAMADTCDILDIGGESTRPGADFVPVAAEIDRTAPVIRAIRDAGITTPISIDTRKAAVARAALAAGADMVNDVSGLMFDPEMAALRRRGCCPESASCIPRALRPPCRTIRAMTTFWPR
jgi:dihydropteroate synthase